MDERPPDLVLDLLNEGQPRRVWLWKGGHLHFSERPYAGYPLSLSNPILWANFRHGTMRDCAAVIDAAFAELGRETTDG